METAERVHRFGTQALNGIHGSLDEAEFQQEYELRFLDESQTYFPYELIFGCVEDALVACRSVDKLVETTTGDLYAGFDVGRTRNTSELIVLERRPKRLVYRYGRSFDRSKFSEQEASLRNLINSSNRLKRLCIDRHGLGMNLAEDLHSEFRSRVEGVALIGQNKESLAVYRRSTRSRRRRRTPATRATTPRRTKARPMRTSCGVSRSRSTRRGSAGSPDGGGLSSGRPSCEGREGVAMYEEHSVGAVLGRMRREVRETLEQIPVRRIRADFVASVVDLYARKLLEMLPGLERVDLEEARALREEALALRDEVMETARRAGGRGGVLGPDPGLN
jgi:hypothetical protein